MCDLYYFFGANFEGFLGRVWVGFLAVFSWDFLVIVLGVFWCKVSDFLGGFLVNF
jgi:hypothetical protein